MYFFASYWTQLFKLQKSPLLVSSIFYQMSPYRNWVYIHTYKHHIAASILIRVLQQKNDLSITHARNWLFCVCINNCTYFMQRFHYFLHELFPTRLQIILIFKPSKDKIVKGIYFHITIWRLILLLVMILFVVQIILFVMISSLECHKCRKLSLLLFLDIRICR